MGPEAEQFADDSGPYPDSATMMRGVTMSEEEIRLARLIVDKWGKANDPVLEAFL